MDSNDEVPGFEDLMDNLEAENDVAQSNTRFDDLLVGVWEGAVAQESPANPITTNSNLKGEIERPATSSNQESIYSRARTKTVSFSQNGYTKELLQLTQQPHSLGTEQTPKSLEVDEPPGYEKPHPSKANDLLTNYSPKALEIREEVLEEGEFRVQGSDTVEPPPGFESQAPEKEYHNKKKASSRTTKSVGSKGNHSRSQTTESLEQIARESLQLGKLLGGLIISWHKDSFQQTNLTAGQRWVCVYGEFLKEQFQCAICLIYAPNDPQGRVQVWNQLRTMKACSVMPLILLGDFNEVLKPSERKGLLHTTASMRDLQELVQDLQLLDLQIDKQFTGMRRDSASRIDRILVDKEVIEAFPNT
ncbi:hypothetical protein Cgig2_023832 [Carnegiea gigantea]|uniref:Endonuclease/exonuclease/phosphatase domain-containing protein n=1 Tax=Carnegiea gigantea TaxID=171969 RepID=A0A9Q1K9G2_9CARY|nr:hypothetical protein Cgig2_023832 [Carnegiea gigantea]